MRTCALLLALLLLPAGQLLAADTLLLKNGSQIEGTILRRPAATANGDGQYTLRIDDGTLVLIASNRVGRVLEVSPVERQYDRLLQEMPNTVQGHITMAQWCHKHELRKQQDFHWEEVLKRDAANVDARRALGYTQIRGEWVRPDEYMRSRGYERVNGTWQLPQQAEARQRQNQIELAEKKLRKEIRTWRGWLKGRRHDEAVQRILAVRDPLAVSGLRDLLRSERDADVRRLYLDSLVQIRTPLAVDGLVETALQDGEEDLRVKAIDALRESGGRRAIGAFISALGSGNTTTINRSAVALARLEAAEAVPALMGVLVTRHETVVAPPPGNMSASFGNTSSGGAGVNGFSTGGGPKRIVQHSRNKAVLEALIALTGQNYQYSAGDWKTWYVNKNSL
ncbi:MAG: HEAT repeat domain-containing protein, partial [Planctomycetales bacterium]|nr:HEAT repeat domain-containing protein [Planctomycetales bacterium]